MEEGLSNEEIALKEAVAIHGELSAWPSAKKVALERARAESGGALKVDTSTTQEPLKKHNPSPLSRISRRHSQERLDLNSPVGKPGRRLSAIHAKTDVEKKAIESGMAIPTPSTDDIDAEVQNLVLRSMKRRSSRALIDEPILATMAKAAGADVTVEVEAEVET